MAGIITTASNYKNVLKETDRDVFGNATWRQAYSNIALEEQKAQAQISQQYGEAIGKAYEAAAAQRSSIGASALGTGYKNALLAENNDALSAAYDQYIANMQSANQTITTSYDKARAQLDELLQERATNMKGLETEFGKYWGTLDTWFSENLTPEDYRLRQEDALWSRFYKYDKETDTYTAKTYEELSQPVYDKENDEWLSIYDADGNVTDFGRDFFDMMLNEYGQKTATGEEVLPQSFAEYLAANNAELYEWAADYNPYSFSPVYTADGQFLSTNIGRFKELMGLESNDQTYRYIERMTGTKEKVLSKSFDDLMATIPTDDIMDEKDMQKSMDSLKSLVNKFGIGGADWEALEKSVNQAAAQYEQLSGEITGGVWSAIISTVIASVGGSIIGGASGAAAGTTAGPAGSFAGAIAGGVAGLAVGGIQGYTSAAQNNDEIRSYKYATNKEVNELLLDSMAILVNEAFKDNPALQTQYIDKLKKHMKEAQGAINKKQNQLNEREKRRADYLKHLQRDYGIYK